LKRKVGRLKAGREGKAREESHLIVPTSIGRTGVSSPLGEGTIIRCGSEVRWRDLTWTGELGGASGEES